MKLNYKNTILVGLAFLAITAFWQMYDNVIPLILTNTFKLNETISGAIMAADNILALFLLPVFGRLSDKTKTKIGKRMPYILGGTAAAVVLINILPVIDDKFASGVNGVFYSVTGFIIVLGLLLFTMSVFRSPAVALMPDAFLTVQRLGEEPRHGGFARSAGPAEKIRVSNLVVFDRVPHRADDGTLARHFFESGRAVFVIERFVCH